MTSPLMEYLGIAGLDIESVAVYRNFCCIADSDFNHCTVCKVQKAEEKVRQIHERQRRKESGKDIIALFEDNKFIKSESEKNRKDIRNILKKLEFCYQKAGLVKYDAYNQMGGNLSFCRCAC